MNDYSTKRQSARIERLPSFMEDGFDLEAFQVELAKTKKKKRNPALSVALNLMLALLLSLVAYQVYVIAKYYYDLEQNRVQSEEARAIFGEAGLNRSLVPLLSVSFKNPDVVAYLDIPGAGISYPVVRGKDNGAYLKRGFDGKSNAAGAIFMDSACEPLGLASRNYVICGHDMKNETMFHNLRYYNSDWQFFKENMEINLVFRDCVAKWEVYAAYRVSTGFNYDQVVFENDYEFMELLDNIQYKAAIKTDAELGPDDKILTLSTCPNAKESERLVVNARLVEVIMFDAP